MQVFGASDVGRKRSLNEDNFSVATLDSIVVAVVCDGMGGAKAGEVASRIACKRFAESIVPRLRDIKEKIKDRAEFIVSVNRAIYEASENSNEEVFSRSSSDNSLSGMGTTLSGCVIIDDTLWTFNIGDSRVYHITDDSCRQLTVDHSFVQSLLDAGKITEEEAQNHPNKNVILRALGIKKGVECDVHHMELDKGYYLICSDGLSNYFNKEDFIKIVTSGRSVSEKVERLVSYANEKGGSDNITVVLIDTQK